jgi:predicted aldo/keto reductase-like oxidoreductase
MPVSASSIFIVKLIYLWRRHNLQYRTDRISGNKLSVLAYGCMRFPTGLTGIDLRKAEELVMCSIEGEVNYVDTA